MNTLLVVISFLGGALANGYPSKYRHDFNYLVSIFSTRDIVVANCLGVKISHNTVFAPAHCLAGYELKDITVCSVDGYKCPRRPVEPCLAPTEVYIYNSYLRTLQNNQLCPDIAIIEFPDYTFTDHEIRPLYIDPKCNCRKYVNKIGKTLSCNGCYLQYSDVVFTHNQSVNPFGYNFASCYLFAAQNYDYYSAGCFSESGSPLFFEKKLLSIKTFCYQDCAYAGPEAYPCLTPYENEILNYKDYFLTLDTINSAIAELTIDELIQNQAFLVQIGVYKSLFKDAPLRGYDSCY